MATISKHLVVDIQGLLRHLNSQRSERKKNEIAMAFGVYHWAQLVSECNKMLNDGLEVIPNEKCDNRDEKGHCLGHTKSE